MFAHTYRKKEGTEKDPLPPGEQEEEDYREGEGEHEDDGEDLFREDEDFGEQEGEFKIKEKVEQKEDSFDIFGDDE